MCGIVVYFGGAGNNLTRILNAMSAIIYRAPDSTGIGFFGDDVNSLRVRKSLGSVADLIPVLLDDPVYPNAAAEQLAIFIPGESSSAIEECQRRLLTFEGFSPDFFDTLSRGRQPFATFDDLVDLDAAKAMSIAPGFPGCTDSSEELRIRSRKDLRRTIQYLIRTYDFSPLAIQILIRRNLAATLQRRQAEGKLDIEPADILIAFDRLFDQSILGEPGPRPQRLEYNRFPRNPYVQKYLWQNLIRTRVDIPADFNRDGVRCLFRLLDAALLSRLPHDSALEDALNVMLHKLWQKKDGAAAVDWKTLYKTEKAVNVYGRAAGAALAHLQEKEYIPELLKRVPEDRRSANGPRSKPGTTDPMCLRYLALPIISQGRWSLQSSVSVQNAHPFFDQRQQRLIALNGKFDTGLESELRAFLKRVAKVSFRSENSSEYVALLWGYYYRQLIDEKQRCETIMAQVKAGSESIGIGSQAIDYRLYHRVKTKTTVDLDAMAFTEAARQIVRKGGQVAVTGISLMSPRRVYVASHNRPIFIVRRLENDDFMVVSDINAAMGLFPHALIHERTLALLKLRKDKKRALQELKTAGSLVQEKIHACEAEFGQKAAKLLEVFKVMVYPIVGEEILARIMTTIDNRKISRNVLITDFDGNPLPDFEATTTVLRPPAIRDDLYRSYYENHLHEIPQRLTDILDYYNPEGSQLPVFSIREDRLYRHFGSKLITLKRIVLVGVAGSYNMAAASRLFLHGLLPDIEVVALTPAEIDDPAKIIDSDTDLVILLSWSATTADMVELAKRLQAMKALTVAITEKTFGDMALYAAKSVGVIPVLSGEEVTVTGIKSTVCMLFCLHLFTIWLAVKKGRRKAALYQLQKLRRIPGTIGEMITDETLKAFSKELAAQSTQSCAALVLDALNTVGTGYEAASKLEEMSWTAVGLALDYKDLRPEALQPDLNKNLILVNATSKARLTEALRLMKELAESRLPFAAVTFSNRELADMKRFTGDRVICLPKTDDALQPHIDLIFHYQFAFHYGLAHGRNAEDFPRNRVKSVTASRSSPWLTWSAAKEMQHLKQQYPMRTAPDGARRSISKASPWERQAGFEGEGAYYKEMRRLAEALKGTDPLGGLLDLPHEDRVAVNQSLSEVIAKEGDIIIITFDRTALAASRNVAANLRRVLGCRLKVVAGDDYPSALSDNTISISVATRPPERKRLAEVVKKTSRSHLWLGPALTKPLTKIFRPDDHIGRLRNEFQSNRADVIYMGLMLLIAGAWEKSRPNRAKTLSDHMKSAGAVIERLLKKVSIRKDLKTALMANRAYHTAFFVGPPVGGGIFWSEAMKKSEHLILKAHLFGEGAYGPIVTIDGGVEKKFLKLENARQMISDHGKRNVARWEKRFLNGTGIDTFLSHPAKELSTAGPKPFFAEGEWYLPVLQEGYEAAEDNLIIVDATSERYFASALDELATYGCRYARLIVLSQEAFRGDPDKKVLYEYPISHLIELPAMDAMDGSAIPISDFLLPFALNAIGVAAASAAVS